VKNCTFRTILALSPRIRFETRILLHIQAQLDAHYHSKHCCCGRTWKFERLESEKATNSNSTQLDSNP